MTKWKCRKSELILDTKFFKVRKDTVELPNKDVREWIYWDSKDSAMMLGMTKNRNLVMIRQYRYLAGDVIEFPSGGLHEGEDIMEGAKREFEEETGYKCCSAVRLGSFYETYGQLNRKIHVFFSNEIEKSRQRLDSGDGYENITVELVDFEKVVEMTLENKIVAMGSALAILLLKEKIERKDIVI